MIPPLVGDGMAMALRSAELLAPLADAHLRGSIGERELERAYEAAWREAFARPVRVSRLLARLLASPPAAELALRAVGAMPGLGPRLVAATRSRPAPAGAAAARR
jgi:flavin-dependent dehydrogenase